MSKRGQSKKQPEVREKILNVARKIVAEEGIQGLSIRKITNAIDYSPAIVYHYFKDKNEIVELLVSEGYGRILRSVSNIQRNEEEPEQEIKAAFTNYIRSALEYPDEYQAFLLNNDPQVLARTALLEKGISKESRTLQMLTENIQRGIEQGRYAAVDPELTAQILWTSTFGLIIKLMMEEGVSEEQVERLIDHHFNLLFHGLMERKEV